MANSASLDPVKANQDKSAAVRIRELTRQVGRILVTDTLEDTPDAPRIAFKSNYRRAVHRGCVTIPARWRNARKYLLFPLAEGPGRNGLVALPLQGHSPEKARQMLDTFGSLADADNEFMELFSLGVVVTMQKSGSIRIPDPLLEVAGIGNEAHLVGLFDRFQIWEPSRSPESGCLCKYP